MALSPSSWEPPKLRQEEHVARPSPQTSPKLRRDRITTVGEPFQQTKEPRRDKLTTAGEQTQESIPMDLAESNTMLQGFQVSLRERSIAGERRGWSSVSRGCGGRRVAPRLAAATRRLAALTMAGLVWTMRLRFPRPSLVG